MENYIILGRTSDGKNITLYKWFEIKKSFSSNGFTITIIFSNIVFEGVHFNKEEDIKFNEISCNYSNLDEWAWMNGFNIKENKQYDEIEIKYRLPSREIAEVNKDYIVEIYPNTKMSNYNLVQKEVAIIQKVYAKVINKNLNSFEEHMKELNYVQNLISLGVGKSVVVMDLVGKTEANKEEFEGDFFYSEVKIYFCIKNSTSQRKILPPQMLFTLRDIKADFSNILKRWFERKELLEPVINLYFGTLYNSNMYLEQRFSSLIQAIESYHRRTKINTEIGTEDHEERVNSILSSVDSKYKEWLKSKLLYSNEPSLRKRLESMVKECSGLINLESSKQKKSFINKVCDTRNYFTHYDESLANRAEKGSELLNICNKLEIIIEFNLLLEIGFNKDSAYELLKKKYIHGIDNSII